MTVKFKKASCRGFTLVELITVLAISTILFIGLITIYQSSLRMTVNGERSSQAQSLAKSASETLERVLRYADTLDIQEELPGNVNRKYNYIYLDDGELMQMYWGVNPEYLLAAKKLEGYTFDIDFEKTGLDIMQLSVTVLYKDEEIYTLESDIYLQNLMDASVTGMNSGKCICYQGTGITVNRITIFASYSICWEDDMPIYFSAITSPRNASTPGVAWSVNDESIATIDQTGVLTPLKNGTVTVKATALDGSTTYKTKDITIINQN